jgi:hypothetical protein
VCPKRSGTRPSEARRLPSGPTRTLAHGIPRPVTPY